VRDPKKHGPYTPADFMPDWDIDEETAQSPEKLLHVVEQWNIALGGKDLRKKE